MAAAAVDIVIHPSTQSAIDAYAAEPVHGLLLTGTRGIGKSVLTRLICSLLLGEQGSTEAHPYIRIIRSPEGKAISIETIRELQQFLNLRVPGNDSRAVTRIIIIEDAGLMTREAQNALLKTLEEPPAGTVLLLTANTLDAVLPTIQSRVRQLAVMLPSNEQVAAHFVAHGHQQEAVDRALRISGGLPGLTQTLLSEDESHPLYIAATHARGILQSKTYERLLLVDSLSKQKELCADILFVLGRMSRMALERATEPASAQRWTKILSATHVAERQLMRSVQAKLVLTNFMLAV